jgi:hypothetical protein
MPAADLDYKNTRSSLAALGDRLTELARRL